MQPLTLAVALLALASATLHADPWVLVSNRASRTISVIDPETLQVIHTASVGAAPIRMGLKPDGSKLYVSNSESNTLSVVDTSVFTTSASSDNWPMITVNQFPSEMEFSKDGAFLYVICKGGANPANSRLVIVNTATNTVAGKVDIGFQPYSLIASPDKSQLFAATPELTTVSAINIPSSGIPTAADIVLTPAGQAPRRIYYNLAGTRAYVTNADGSNLTVINPKVLTTNPANGTPSYEVVGQIPTGAFPRGMAFTPDGRLGYVTNVQGGSVTVFNVETSAFIANIGQLGFQAWSAAVPPANDFCYVVSSASGNISVIDVHTNQVAKTINAGSSAYWIAHYDRGHRLFVTQPTLGSVSVIDSTTQSKVSEIPTGIEPWMVLAYDPGTPPGIVVPAFSPVPLPLNSSSDLEIEGSGFEYGVEVSVSPSNGGVTLEPFFHGPSRVTLTVNVSAAAAAGFYDLTIQNPNGQTVTLNDALNVTSENPPLTVSAVSPSVAFRDPTPDAVTATTITLTGAGFVGPLSISATPAATDLTFANINLLSGTQFTAEARVTSNAQLGPRSFTVTDGDGETALVENKLTIEDLVPELGLTSVSPSQFSRNITVTARLTGTGFAPGMTAAIKPSARGVRISSLTVIDSTAADAVFVVQSSATIGGRDLELTVGTDTVLKARAINITN